MAVQKFGYIIKNHYLYSVANKGLIYYKTKTALAGRINNSKQIMENQKKQKQAAQGLSVISLSLVDKNCFNLRKTFNEEALEGLALGMKDKGN